MTRRLWLHIGSHKTGSTTLQNFFLENEAALARAGLTHVHTAKATINTVIAAASTTDFPPRGFELRDPDGLGTALDKARTPELFASSENFSYFFDRAAIQSLADCLFAHVDEVRILVYLRRQDRLALSHHQEAAKPHRFGASRRIWGNDLAPLPKPDPRHAWYIDYETRIGHWADVFGDANVVARVFDRTCLVGGDVVQDALSVLGRSGDGLDFSDDRNVSLGAMQSWVGHLLNGAGVSEPLIQAAQRLVEDSPRALPAREEAMAFYAPWRDSNARLNRRLKIVAEPALFSEDFSDYPEVSTPAWDLPAAESILRLMTQLIAAQSLPVEDLRDAALALRRQNPEAARRFAEAALKMRPNAPAVRRLLDALDAGEQPARDGSRRRPASRRAERG